MTRRSTSRKLMIMDACVLIDFIKAERAVLELVVKNVGPLYVTSPVVEEVKEIDDEDELAALGLIIVEPEIEDAYTEGIQSGPLSFEDWLCLLTARRHGFTCVTNVELPMTEVTGFLITFRESLSTSTPVVPTVGCITQPLGL